MDRRRFLQLITGGGVVAAAATEMGLVAEFWQWLSKRPKWFLPKQVKIKKVIPGTPFHDDLPPQLLYDAAELQRLATVYYDKAAVENLKANLTFGERFKDRGQRTLMRAHSKDEVIRHIQMYGWNSVWVKE